MTDHFLTVTTVERDGVVVLAATGEIDRESRDVLGDAAGTATGEGLLVIDLTGVTFCDSSGLSLFVELHRKARVSGGELRLAGLQDMVATVVRATNLDRLLLLHPSVDDAVAAARRAG
jgi:anti-sigma B factor antagonist